MKTLERKARMKFQTQIKNFINRMHKHIMELPVERKVGLKSKPSKKEIIFFMANIAQAAKESCAKTATLPTEALIFKLRHYTQ